MILAATKQNNVDKFDETARADGIRDTWLTRDQPILYHTFTNTNSFNSYSPLTCFTAFFYVKFLDK